MATVSELFAAFGNTLNAALADLGNGLDEKFASIAVAAGDPDAEAKAKLTEMLNDDKYDGRSLNSLSKAIGKDADATRNLLATIGATHYKTGPRSGKLYFSL